MHGADTSPEIVVSYIEQAIQALYEAGATRWGHSPLHWLAWSATISDIKAQKKAAGLQGDNDMTKAACTGM